jgi:hypothetical protein
MSRTWVFGWHAQLRAGRTSIEDDWHTGRPISCTMPHTVAKLQQLVRKDRRRTIQDCADEIRIGYGTCQRILTAELGMHRVTAKSVPKVLTADQKQCSTSARSFIRSPQFYILLWRFTATEWKCLKTSPRTLVTKELAVASWQHTISHFLFHQGIFYQKQHDCCPPPTLLAWFGPLRLFSVSLIEDKTERLPFRHNWSDWGRIAGDAEHLTEYDFQDAFKKWQKRWERCIRTEGDYFEGDGGQ